MGIADATENDGEDAVTPMKCFTAQDRAKLDRQAVALARDPDSPLERALARFGAAVATRNGIEQGDGW
jgi:hypothetical protein